MGPYTARGVLLVGTHLQCELTSLITEAIRTHSLDGKQGRQDKGLEQDHACTPLKGSTMPCSANIEKLSSEGPGKRLFLWPCPVVCAMNRGSPFHINPYRLYTESMRCGFAPRSTSNPQQPNNTFKTANCSHIKVIFAQFRQTATSLEGNSQLFLGYHAVDQTAILFVSISKVATARVVVLCVDPIRAHTRERTVKGIIEV